MLEHSSAAIQMCDTYTASTPDAVGIAVELNKRTQTQFAQAIHYKNRIQKLPTKFTGEWSSKLENDLCLQTNDSPPGQMFKRDHVFFSYWRMISGHSYLDTDRKGQLPCKTE